MTNVIELNDGNFEQEVKNSALPVMVDFYATWCGPCRSQLPIVDKIADEFAGKVKIAKLNVDDGQATSAAYGIASIPALIVFKNGQVVESLVGLHSHSQLSEILNEHI